MILNTYCFSSANAPQYYVDTYSAWIVKYFRTYLLTPCSRFLHEKLTRLQPVNKSPAFPGTRRLIRAFTRARHLSLSWAISIQSMPHPTSWTLNFNSFLSSTPRFSQWSQSIRSPHQTPVITPPVFHICHVPCRSHCPSLDHPNNIWWGVQIIKLYVM